MLETKVEWIATKERMPTREEFGAYPCVLVALACKGQPDWGHQTRTAELRFFGGDVARPYWAGHKGENCKPIENDSWFVEYWAAPLQLPKTPNVN